MALKLQTLLQKQTKSDIIFHNQNLHLISSAQQIRQTHNTSCL
jgi:hypothetical protein